MNDSLTLDRPDTAAPRLSKCSHVFPLRLDVRLKRSGRVCLYCSKVIWLTSLTVGRLNNVELLLSRRPKNDVAGAVIRPARNQIVQESPVTSGHTLAAGVLRHKWLIIAEVAR